MRFAPSPTGPLHIGGVRTALYNYLFAKKQQGKFIIRIEDTDQHRYVKGAEEYIFESLNWCGIIPDESPEVGGGFGPYRQSERKEIYLQYAEMLIEKGHAYYGFDTADELLSLRERLKEAGSFSQQYDSASRGSMQNSLTLSPDEVKARIDRGDSYVIRTKIPPDEHVTFFDLIRGAVTVDTNHLDDKVLFKSDGWPTYHLANIVDDYLMQISHVIRGEEWLPSAPLHVLLYKFFGWTDVMPQFAHLPLLLRPDGNGKLSKRDGDRLGFPVFPISWLDPTNGERSIGFRERGFFPEALVNFISLLGWHPEGEKELITPDEMISEFSIENVHKSGAKFDFEKAKWFNHEYLKKMNDNQIAELFIPVLDAKNIIAKEDYVVRVCSFLKNRCTFIAEFWENGSFFFQRPVAFDSGVVRSKWNETSRKSFELLLVEIKSMNGESPSSADEFLQDFLLKNILKAGDLLPLLRVALIGSKNGPAVFEIIYLLGKEEAIQRIQQSHLIFEGMIPNP